MECETAGKIRTFAIVKILFADPFNHTGYRVGVSRVIIVCLGICNLTVVVQVYDSLTQADCGSDPACRINAEIGEKTAAAAITVNVGRTCAALCFPWAD